ncbi:MAG: substrate-binding domain-containing protein [Chloroflexi bacterium]|nr:substrate-binding domain-containing protein [Chloroflexota bacterium]
MSKVKNISRRNFLKGAGTVAASSLLPGFPNIVRADNHEINLVGWGREFREAQYDQVLEATEIKISWEGLPTGSWSDVMQKFTLWGQTGYAHYDIMYTDDLLAGMYGMNGWALDLSDLNAYTDNADDLTDSVNVLDNAMGGVFRIFFFMGATPFFYNTDLVPEHPSTWDDFISAGLAATDQEAGVWGWRPLGGGATPSIPCCWRCTIRAPICKRSMTTPPEPRSSGCTTGSTTTKSRRHPPSTKAGTRSSG